MERKEVRSEFDESKGSKGDQRRPETHHRLVSFAYNPRYVNPRYVGSASCEVVERGRRRPQKEPTFDQSQIDVSSHLCDLPLDPVWLGEQRVVLELTTEEESNQSSSSKKERQKGEKEDEESERTMKLTAPRS